MHRYQCPHCHSFRDRDREPKCPRHSLNYSPNCSDCRRVAAQIASS